MIGDRFGLSADPALVDLAGQVASAGGHRVARNIPYAGGYALERHGRPSSGVHALQLELDRALYLDAGLRAPGPGLSAAAALVTAGADALDAAVTAPSALAAE